MSLSPYRRAWRHKHFRRRGIGSGKRAGSPAHRVRPHRSLSRERDRRVSARRHRKRSWLCRFSSAAWSLVAGPKLPFDDSALSCYPNLVAAVSLDEENPVRPSRRQLASPLVATGEQRCGRDGDWDNAPQDRLHPQEHRQPVFRSGHQRVPRTPQRSSAASTPTSAPATADATSLKSRSSRRRSKKVSTSSRISPNSPDALNEVLDQAKAKGITIITVDADLVGNESHRDAAVLPKQTSPRSARPKSSCWASSSTIRATLPS